MQNPIASVLARRKSGAGARGVFDGREFELRRVRLTDYASWRTIRLANERRLAPAFKRPDRTWEECHSPMAWVEWFADTAVGSLRRTRYALVIVEHAAGKPSRVVGEVGLCGVDPVTRAGELSAWVSDSPGTLVPWGLANVIDRVFAPEYGLERIVAPGVETKGRPAHLVAALGMERIGTRRDFRIFNGEPTDHMMCVLENTPEVRASMRALAAGPR